MLETFKCNYFISFKIKSIINLLKVFFLFIHYLINFDLQKMTKALLIVNYLINNLLTFHDFTIYFQ